MSVAEQEWGHMSLEPDDVAGLVDQLKEYLAQDPPQISAPPRVFTSPGLYDLEFDRVFSRSWLLICHTDELAEPGDYVATTVMNEPVVVTRGADGALHAMSSVCRHRMMPVIEDGSGNTRSFTCPYHLWRYGLDGRLIGATYMRRNKDFDPAKCRLPPFAVEEWNGFVYVNLSDTAPALRPHLARIETELANYRLGDMVQIASWDQDWECNWKVAVENAHENYHVMGFHAQTLNPSTPGGADMELRVDSPWALRFLVPFSEPQPTEVLSLTEREKAHLYGFYVFPTGSLAASGEMVLWLTFLPQSIDRTRVRGGMLVPAASMEGEDPDETREQTEAYAAVINEEDRRGLEAVQRAVGSRFAGRGHLSPKEPGVAVFYRNLALALTGDSGWPSGS